MKPLVALLALFALVSCNSQSIPKSKQGVAIIGASFAYPENGWFELACQSKGYKPINKAASGECIVHSALKFAAGTLFTEDEFESFETLTIMFTHNDDIFNIEGSTIPHTGMNRAAAFDYVIRKYISMCEQCESNPHSEWYGIKGGKPVDIILCTHWHDARETYNNSVRRLAKRWSNYARLCEFDKKIGFSKSTPDPKTGQQASVSFAHPDANSCEIINGVTYGWHPKRGVDSPIQRRMAKIFAELI